jgi:hypothetical protein
MRGLDAMTDHGLDTPDATLEPPAREAAWPAAVIAEAAEAIARHRDGPETDRLLARLAAVGRHAAPAAPAQRKGHRPR